MGFLIDFFGDLFGIKNNNRDDSNQGIGHEHLKNLIWQNDEEEINYDDTNTYSISHHYINAGSGTHVEVSADISVDDMQFIEAEMEKLTETLTSSLGWLIPELKKLPSTYENTLSSETEKNSIRDEVMKSELSPDRPKVEEVFDRIMKKLPMVSGYFEDLKSQNEFSHTFTPTNDVIIKLKGCNVSTINERKTTDSAGNTEHTIIRKSGGNKIHTIIKKTDKQGHETITETFQNMDENDILKSKKIVESMPDQIELIKSKLSSFPWHKFFGNDPKI